jgi:hypothetical protein
MSLSRGAEQAQRARANVFVAPPFSLGLGESHLCANNSKHAVVQALNVHMVVLFDLDVTSLWCVCVRGTR